jgi:hypothetical protein
MQIIIIETTKRDDFYPFSLVHSLIEVRCGIYRTIDRIKALYPSANICFYGEGMLSNLFVKREKLSTTVQYKVPTLIIYSDVLFTSSFFVELNATLNPVDSFLLTNELENKIGFYFPNFQKEDFDFNNNIPNKSINKVRFKKALRLEYL